MITKKEFYNRLTEGSFKDRYCSHGHASDFRVQHIKGTCLSKYVWKLKNDNVLYSLSWKVIARGRGFK